MAQYMYVMHAVDPAKAASQEAWTAEDKETFGLHLARLERLREEGTLLLAGRAQDADGTGPGIVIFEAASDDEARQIFEQEPFFVRGFARGRLHPFRALMSRAEL
jgi:uncharacterized protein YciI